MCHLPSHSVFSMEILEELEQQQTPDENIAHNMSGSATYVNNKLTSQQLNFALILENQMPEKTSCPVKKGSKFLESLTFT